MRSLVIIGAGGHGRETLDVVEAINDHEAAPVWDVLGLVASRHDEVLVGRRAVPVLGDVDVLAGLDAAYVIGIGASDVRRRIDAQVAGYGREAAVLVHPTRHWARTCASPPG